MTEVRHSKIEDALRVKHVEKNLFFIRRHLGRPTGPADVLDIAGAIKRSA